MGLLTSRFFLLSNILKDVFGRIKSVGLHKAVRHSRVTRVRFPHFYDDHENLSNNVKAIFDYNETLENDVPENGVNGSHEIALSLSQPPITPSSSSGRNIILISVIAYKILMVIIISLFKYNISSV